MNKKIEPDRKTVARFISTIQQDWCKDRDKDNLFEIRCVGENLTTINRQFAMNAVKKAISLIVELNGLGLNAYMTINPITDLDEDEVERFGKPATDTDILRAHFSFADADDARGLAGLKQLAKLIKPDLAVQTGSVPCKRYHAYWRLIEPCRDLSMWRQRQSDIARRFGTDPAVVNPSRLMRVAGTVAYPSAAKMARGYIPELTKLKLGAK